MDSRLVGVSEGWSWPLDESPSTSSDDLLEYGPMAPAGGDRGKLTATHAGARPRGSVTNSVNGHQRPPRTSGPVVTDRDRAILDWIGRHGIVTRQHVADRFFAREDGTCGTWAAYRRIRKLVEMGLLQEDHTFWREPMVLRVTPVGARFADLDVRPARLVPAEVRHSLAVVDLLEQLLAGLPKNTTVITEREIRAERRRDLRLDPSRSGLGRMPDAELGLRGKRVAVELDLTPKRSAVYEDILTSYLQQNYDQVWWYVAPRVVERLRKIVKLNQADDFVTVKAWEG